MPDTSSLRGRATTLGSGAVPNVQLPQMNPSVAVPTSVPTRTPLERRPSGASHYRQTSKTHGTNSQSRNALFLNSAGANPVAREGEAVPDSTSSSDLNAILRRGASRRRPSASPSGTSNPSVSGASTLTPERDANETTGTLPTLRKLDRSQSSRNRKEHSHHRSRSRNQQHEQVAVGEYAMHHLFNKASRNLLRD